MLLVQPLMQPTIDSRHPTIHQSSSQSRLSVAAMAANLTPAEHRQLRSLFHLVDRDQSGSITKQELASLLHTLNSPRNTTRPNTANPHSHRPPPHPPLALPTSSAAIDSLIAECDINNDGEIDYAEFAAVMSKRAGCRYSREEVLDAMRVFEVRGVSRVSGELSVELLERAVRMLDMGGVEVRGGGGGGGSSGSSGGSGGDGADGVIGVEAKRQQMLDMLAQLKVNYGGRFAYEQVDYTTQTHLTDACSTCQLLAHLYTVSHSLMLLCGVVWSSSSTTRYKRGRPTTTTTVRQLTYGSSIVCNDASYTLSPSSASLLLQSNRMRLYRIQTGVGRINNPRAGPEHSRHTRLLQHRVVLLRYHTPTTHLYVIGALLTKS